MTIKLWHPRPGTDFRQAINQGETLYADLSKVVGNCMEKGGKWNVARVECPQHFVSPNSRDSYTPNFPIRAKSVVSLEKAEKDYLS